MKSSENLKISREIYMEDLEFIHNRVFLEKAFDYPRHRNYN